jgi:hypothetical protein
MGDYEGQLEGVEESARRRGLEGRQQGPETAGINEMLRNRGFGHFLH